MRKTETIRSLIPNIWAISILLSPNKGFAEEDEEVVMLVSTVNVDSIRASLSGADEMRSCVERADPKKML